MFKVHTAKHIGRRHILNGTNCQDAICVYENPRFATGVICDGCSEGEHSEVGAELAASFLVNHIKTQCFAGFAPYYIASNLENTLAMYLEHVIEMTYFPIKNQKVDYIQNHFLFTVTGFIAINNQVVIFCAGDGTSVIEDKHKFWNMGDTPIYPAYYLIAETLEVELPERSFQVEQHFDLGQFAVGSDAWKDEPDLLPKIWGHEHPNGLQRMINILSDKEHFFSDDVSVITVERI